MLARVGLRPCSKWSFKLVFLSVPFCFVYSLLWLFVMARCCGLGKFQAEDMN